MAPANLRRDQRARDGAQNPVLSPDALAKISGWPKIGAAAYLYLRPNRRPMKNRLAAAYFQKHESDGFDAGVKQCAVALKSS
jgi:hypothetical protein